jgi:hypothetical protein
MKKILLLPLFFFGQAQAQKNLSFQYSIGMVAAHMEYNKLGKQMHELSVPYYGRRGYGARSNVALLINNPGKQNAFLAGLNTYYLKPYVRYTDIEGYGIDGMKNGAKEVELSSVFNGIYLGYSIRVSGNFYLTPRLEAGLCNHSLIVESSYPVPEDTIVSHDTDPKPGFEYSFKSKRNIYAAAGINMEYKFLKQRKANSNAVFSVSAGIWYSRTVKSSSWEAYGVKPSYVGKPFLNAIAADLSFMIELDWRGKRFFPN